MILSFEGELDETYAVRKRGGLGHIYLDAKNKRMAESQLHCICVTLIR